MAGKDDLPFLPTAACHHVPDAAPALCDDTSEWISYGILREAIRRTATLLQKPQRALVLCCAPRSIEGAVAYLGAAESGHAVLLADPASTRLGLLAQTYRPEWILAPAASAFEGYETIDTPFKTMRLWQAQTPAEEPLHPDFFLMLLTSGSTGSPKGIRLSYANLASNTNAIIQSLSLTQAEIACGHMPLSYSFGLSVLQTQLAVGGRTILTEHSMMSSPFWKVMAQRGATLFAGVPYHFEMLMRLGLDRIRVATLTTFLQAGGKMSLPLTQNVVEAVRRRNGKLFVMYGQTEASPRMTCFALHKHPEKMGTSGTALTGGRIEIVEDEVIYYGPNVAMGPAASRADLAEGDVLDGRLATGDLGNLDTEGFLTITGRKQRFAKLFGQRVALDDIEHMAAILAPCVAMEHPEKIILFTCCADEAKQKTAQEQIVAQTKIQPHWMEIRTLPALPVKRNGKIDYQALQNLMGLA